MASFEHAVTRNLQCPICLELMTEPKQLSCSHTFCKTCLTGLLASKSGSTSLSCPVCRTLTNVANSDVSKLSTNIPLKSLIGDVKDKGHLCDVCEAESRAIFYCCDCVHNMCDPCNEQHNKWKPFQNHKVVSVNDIRQGKVVIKKKVFCKDHDPEEEHECTDVCLTCKKFICLRCRMLDHEKKGHDVQSSKEYVTSYSNGLESLLKEAEIKTKEIDEYRSLVEREREKGIEHIQRVKADVDGVYQETLRSLQERKALLDKKCDDEMVWINNKFVRMKDECVKLQACIKSACELATRNSKTPLEEDTVAIRDSLCAELKSILKQKDSDDSTVCETSRYVQTLRFEREERGNELTLGNVHYEKWTLKEDVTLPTKDSMNCLLALPTGEVAVGSRNGEIDILSTDGELQNTVTHNTSILGLACLTNTQYAMADDNNSIFLFTPNWNIKLPSAFETLKFDEGGLSFLAVDTHDNIHISYRKVKKIQVFSVNGGKAVREISCNGYEPCSIYAMKSGLLLVCNTFTVRVINEHGDVKHTLDKEGDRNAYLCVCHNGSVIVAWVSFEDCLVTIKRYTSQLVYMETLISDQMIDIPERKWFQLQELLSEEIVFCTADRLYIFH